MQFRVIKEGEEPEEIRTDGSERDMERLLNHLLQIKRSVEYGSQIIHAQETGTPAVIYGNVGNHGIIENLPAVIAQPDLLVGCAYTKPDKGYTGCCQGIFDLGNFLRLTFDHQAKLLGKECLKDRAVAVQA